MLQYGQYIFKRIPIKSKELQKYGEAFSSDQNIAPNNESKLQANSPKPSQELPRASICILIYHTLPITLKKDKSIT